MAKSGKNPSLLLVSTRVPYPVVKGDQIVAWQRLKTLSTRFTVDLICFSDQPIDQLAMREMQRYCRRIVILQLNPLRALLRTGIYGVLGRTPFQVCYYLDSRLREQIRMLDETYNYDVIHGVLMRVAPHLEAYSNKVVLDLVDSMYLNIQNRIECTRSWFVRLLLKVERNRIARYEQGLGTRFKACLLVSETDRKQVSGKLSEDNTFTIPNGTDLQVPDQIGEESRISKHTECATDGRTLVFVGNLAYHANVSAVTWFVTHVWPRLRFDYPSLRFTVVGRHPTKKIMEWDGKNGVSVTGTVPSILPYLTAADIFVAPMQSGSGMQNKIIEAMAAGLPVVTTPYGAQGFLNTETADFSQHSVCVDELPGMHVAGDIDEFVSKIRLLLEDRQKCRADGRAARNIIDKKYRWEHSSSKLLEVYGQIGLINEHLLS